MGVALATATLALSASTPIGSLTQLPGAQGCLYTPPAPEEEEPNPLDGVCGPAVSLGGVDAVAVSPDGRNVYVAAYDASAVSALSRNPSSGSLSRVPGPGGCIEESADDAEEPVCTNGTALHNPTSIAVAPDGRHVYAIAFLSDALVGFERGPGGALTQLPRPNGCVSRNLTEEACALGWGLDRALALALSPDGRNAYVASSDSSGVAVFARDATGGLRQLADRDGCVLDEAALGREDPDENEERCSLVGRGLRMAGAVAVSPDGRNVYVASLLSDAVAAFRRDAGTGRLAQLDGAAGCLVDANTPEERPPSCGETRALDGPFAVAVSPDGRNVYVGTGFGNNDPEGLPYDATGVTGFARDLRTGALRPMPGTGGCVNENGSSGCGDGTALQSANAIALSPDGRNLYVASVASDAIAVFARDRATGALRQLDGALGCASASQTATCAPARGLTGAYAVTVSPDGANLYAAGPFDDAVATFARTAAQPVVLSARLTGRAARPPGDGDGTASARLTLRDDTICWAIATRRIGTPVAVHLHRGRSGVPGRLIVVLRPRTGTLLRGCRAAPPAEIARITQRPPSYYLDIHNRQYPRGAVRGQLARD